MRRKFFLSNEKDMRPLNEEGVALMQVVLVGALLAVSAYIFAQFMTNSDRESLRMIRRNDNLNFATSLSDVVNDHTLVRKSADILDKDGTGLDITYP